jgi:hypothetical protein
MAAQHEKKRSGISPCREWMTWPLPLGRLKKKELIGRVSAFNHLDGVRTALAGRLADHIFIFFRDDVKFDGGLQLIFVIFEDLGAKVVAIPVSHALAGDFYFHAKSSFLIRMWCLVKAVRLLNCCLLCGGPIKPDGGTPFQSG